VRWNIYIPTHTPSLPDPDPLSHASIVFHNTQAIGWCAFNMRPRIQNGMYVVCSLFKPQEHISHTHLYWVVVVVFLTQGSFLQRERQREGTEMLPFSPSPSDVVSKQTSHHPHTPFTHGPPG
jgi:hypothetical protein